MTSTAEAELNAVVEASKKATHLANFLKEMNIDVEQLLQMFVDNHACIALSKNSMNHGKTKHFALKVLFIRNLVETRLLELNYLHIDRMPADNLTKACEKTKFSLFRVVLLGSDT